MRSPTVRSALPAALAVVALIAILALAQPAAGQTDANRTTTIQVGLEADGDARITVTVRMPLEESVEAEAFERLAREHRTGSDPAPSVSYFRTSASRAAEAGERSMVIRDVSRSAGRSTGVGRLSTSFTWTNFSTVENGRLQVGDVFRTPGGTWLSGLTEQQELTIEPPPGYDPNSIVMSEGARHQLTNGTIRVEGPATFRPGYPSIVLERNLDGPDPFLAAIALGGIALALVLGYLFRGRLQNVIVWSEREPDGPVGTEPTGSTEEVDPELLSDEEQVLRLLETRGGRMKQVDIVEETDWSNAKVSQLLSEMEESGRVEKLRIGRENLISLPGEGPAAGGSGAQDVN